MHVSSMVRSNMCLTCVRNVFVMSVKEVRGVGSCSGGNSRKLWDFGMNRNMWLACLLTRWLVMVVREVTKTATRIGASQVIGVNSVDNRRNGHGMNWMATERV